MDVVWGEAAGVEGQLWLLYPILFTLQVPKTVRIIKPPVKELKMMTDKGVL